jgi:hypothetical protein
MPIVQKWTFLQQQRPIVVSTSIEDDIVIGVLCTAFPLLAIDLYNNGGWKGCALSAGWCVTYDDPPSRYDGLPPGTIQSRILAILSTSSALLCRVIRIWRQRIHIASLGGSQKIALAFLVLSHTCLVSCAVIPMSCGCLIDGERWVSISIRDDIHDNSLLLYYLGTIACGVLAGYGSTTSMNTVRGSIKKGNRRRAMLFWTCIFAILQSWGIYRCPISTDYERIGLLILEVIAIAVSQFLHHGTVDHLIRTSQGCAEGS